MTDHILSAALTFALLIGGAAAFGSELVGHRNGATVTTAQVTLPAITVTAHRVAPALLLAAETNMAQPQRAE